MNRSFCTVCLRMDCCPRSHTSYLAGWRGALWRIDGESWMGNSGILQRTFHPNEGQSERFFCETCGWHLVSALYTGWKGLGSCLGRLITLCSWARFSLKNIQVKWANGELSENQKIAGGLLVSSQHPNQRRVNTLIFASFTDCGITAGSYGPLYLKKKEKKKKKNKAYPEMYGTGASVWLW